MPVRKQGEFRYSDIDVIVYSDRVLSTLSLAYYLICTRGWQRSTQHPSVVSYRYCRVD